MNAEARFSRQQDVVPQDRLANIKASVIGVGAIGRQVALQLTAIGVRRLQLVDFDTVEESNIATQGYFEDDIGRPKVRATAHQCQQINHGLMIDEQCGRFRRSMDIGTVVFVCVDSIDIRRLIWNATRHTVALFVDGRMSAESLRVLTASQTVGQEHYPDTLFRAEEAYQGTCTAKSTIFCANIAAGLMVSQFTKYLRRLPLDCDIQFNLLSNELSVLDS